MTSQEKEELIESITSFRSDRDYWFVRTLGGEYYSSFLEHGYIAIGYDAVRLSDIKKEYAEIGISSLNEIVKQTYPYESRPGYVANQLVDFAFSIKKGDIVLIPGDSSNRISIGEVSESSVTELSAPPQWDACPFLKRKSVKWLKQDLVLGRLDPQLYKLKFIQRTISFIDPDLTPFIDRILTPLFIKNDKTHLSLRVDKEDHVGAYALFSTWSELIDLTEEFCNEEGLDFNKEEFDLRINVQSPGTIEFISYSVVSLTALALLVATFIGAEYETSRFFKFKLKTDGLIKRISDYKDRRADRILKKRLDEKVQKMNLNVDDVVNILRQLNKHDPNEN